MTRYRAFLEDWFEYVDADSEEAAKEKMAKLVRETVSANNIITWEVSECMNFTHVADPNGRCTRCGVKLNMDGSF